MHGNEYFQSIYEQQNGLQRLITKLFEIQLIWHMCNGKYTHNLIAISPMFQ